MPKPKEKAVFILVEEHGYAQRIAAEMIGLTEARVSQLYTSVMAKYASVKAMAEGVPEPQLRRIFLGTN